MPTTPPLDAEYAAWPIWPSKAATDAVLTMTPRSSSIGSVLAIRSAASRSTLNVPIRLTSMTFLKPSSGNGPSLPSVLTALPMPAQLTLMRSGPSDSASVERRGHGGLVGDVGSANCGAVAELARPSSSPGGR